jgi:hypothetical protein
MGHNIELHSLLSPGVTSAQCASSPTIASDRRQSDVTSCDVLMSLSRASIDLEASLLDVHPRDAEHQHDVPKHSWSAWFNGFSVQHSLYRVLFIMYQASCRVVKIEQKNHSISWTNEINNLDDLISSPLRNLGRPFRRSEYHPPPDWPVCMRAAHRILSSIWTQPVILFLILLQTAVLVRSANKPAYSGIVAFSTYRTSWDVQCNVAIFSLYTVELLPRAAVHLFSLAKKTGGASHLNLRHIYNILDALAVVSFWVNLTVMATTQYDGRLIQALEMFSALRILRLLHITAGTDYEITILFRGLKTSRMKLVKVASFICFFWLLFAIVGVQVFNGSLRRSCYMPSLVADEPPIAIETTLEGQSRFCVGFRKEDNTTTFGYLLKGQGGFVALRPGGYICPKGMLCQEFENPYKDTVSFDNILQSLELVFVTFSANTFSAIMYSLMDSEGPAAALFFAAVIVVLYFWLLILLIGMIMGSIQEVRQSTQAPEIIRNNISDQRNPKASSRLNRCSGNPFQRAFRRTKWFWLAIIVLDLVAQAQRASGMSNKTRLFIDYSESVVTWLLLSEIILRFVLDWEMFHRSNQNLVDLLLATLTSIMQIGLFRHTSRIYTWFTAFSIARSYRIFWAINPVRNLMVRINTITSIVAHYMTSSCLSATFLLFFSSVVSYFF